MGSEVRLVLHFCGNDDLSSLLLQIAFLYLKLLTNILLYSAFLQHKCNPAIYFQCGDYKYPDVTSPLNRILCRNRFSRHESAQDNEEISIPRSYGSSGSLLRQGDALGRQNLW